MKKNRETKKTEFSKKWLIVCVVISIAVTITSYVFAWFDKNTVETLTIQIIDVLWGTSGISFVGYALQNCVRAYTGSKFGLPDEDDEEKGEVE